FQLRRPPISPLFPYTTLFRSCSDAEELVHLDIPLLSNAKCSVGSLVLHCRVPPAVEMEHVVSCRQIEANATSLEREDEDRWATADRKSTRLNSSHGSISYAVF